MKIAELIESKKVDDFTPLGQLKKLKQPIGINGKDYTYWVDITKTPLKLTSSDGEVLDTVKTLEDIAKLMEKREAKLWLDFLNDEENLDSLMDEKIIRLKKGNADQRDLENALTESLDQITVVAQAPGSYIVSTKAKAGPILRAIYNVYREMVNKAGVSAFTKLGKRINGIEAETKLLSSRPNGLVFKFENDEGAKEALEAAVEKAVKKVEREEKAEAAHKESAPQRRKEAAAAARVRRDIEMEDYDKKYGKGTWRRVTYKQEGGDDGRSYVVRVDGRKKWDGLSQREAMYYKQKEVNLIAKNEKLGKYAEE